MIPEYSRHLTIRGKNLTFLGAIAAALQLDTYVTNVPFADLKRAFSPKAVQQIHLAIAELWPDLDDFEACIGKEDSDVTALYTGSYEPAAVFRAITRHCLYSEKIYLVDPFLDPRMIADEFNPVVHPDQHRATTIKHAFLWITLAPWIKEGIVNFIRPLDNFVPGLYHEVLQLQRRRNATSPELAKIEEEETEELLKKSGPMDGSLMEHYFLSFHDEHYREMYRGMPADNPFQSPEKFLEYIQNRRDRHPYYVDMLPGQNSELLHHTTGANYELAKRMCALTNSHMITDMRYRWKELELDRPQNAANDHDWSPFAKALQNAPLKILGNVELRAALALRNESRLERMRFFFNKVWKSCREPNEFSESNAINLAAELSEKIAEAEAEWKKIDQEILKWFGVAGAAAVAGASTGFLPALPVAGVGGIAALIEAQLKRRSFRDRYPAGFFLGVERK